MSYELVSSSCFEVYDSKARTHRVSVLVTLLVDEAVTLFTTGKVVVLVTVLVVSMHLTQTVLMNEFACLMRLLKAAALASAVAAALVVAAGGGVVVRLGVVAGARLAFANIVVVRSSVIVLTCTNVDVLTTCVTSSVETVVGTMTAGAVTLRSWGLA